MVWGIIATWSIAAYGDATAPLNGTATFPTPSAASDKLKVNAGSNTIKATGAFKIQGHANSRITVVSTPGSGTVHVANVTNREGTSLYHVDGIYVGNEIGGTAKWDAEYNRGDLRLIIEINDPSSDDDDIRKMNNGGMAKVTLAGDNVGECEVSLSKKSGSGNISFSKSSLTYSGPGTKSVYVNGLAEGTIEIQATSPGITTVTDSGKVSVPVSRSSDAPKSDNTPEKVTDPLFPMPGQQIHYFAEWRVWLVIRVKDQTTMALSRVWEGAAFEENIPNQTPGWGQIATIDDSGRVIDPCGIAREGTEDWVDDVVDGTLVCNMPEETMQVSNRVKWGSNVFTFQQAKERKWKIVNSVFTVSGF